jgi:carboxypeptidase Q
MSDVVSLLKGLGLDSLAPGGSGSDIGPIVEAGKFPSMSLSGETSRYFTLHHTPADTVDKIPPGEVGRAAAAIAVIAYVVADMPDRFGR